MRAIMFVSKSVCCYLWILNLCIVLICLESVLGWPWSELARFTRQDDLGLDGATNGSNDTLSTTTTTSTASTTGTPDTTTTGAPPTPVLTADAIANIAASGVAIIFLTTVLCYLMITFNQAEHRTRVKTALQRNEQIDRQIAAARTRQQQQKLEEHEQALYQEGLKVETVGGAEDRRRLAGAPLDTTKTIIKHESPDVTSIRVGETEVFEEAIVASKSGEDGKDVKTGSSGKVVATDVEDKVSGSSSVDDDDKPLISVSGASYNTGGEVPSQQPVLLVEPAKPEEIV